MDKIQKHEGPTWDLAAQLAAIRAAAAKVDIADNVALDGWLALSLGELQTLKARLAVETKDWGGARPHGIFISTFNRIENGRLIPQRSDIPPIEIQGTLSIFGEIDSGDRPPYLVIGLVTKDAPESGASSIVRAYAHPCVRWDRLTLLDSGLERASLQEILNCRDWLFNKFMISMLIEKPLFDMGTEEADVSRGPCLPDFVLRASGTGVRHSTIVVETMGYADQIYRERKRKLRVAFEGIDRHPEGTPTPVIEHDRFRTEFLEDPDERLWKDIRWAVTSLRAR
ncbi:hypothetical protein [Rhodopseudomonas sp. RCAM05734]|uniref:hypothetical protein n=1 Tax=Rhodopseudomonas sp. RCAM05734 TaxID=3457549 RepID=UPI004043EB92